MATSIMTVDGEVKAVDEAVFSGLRSGLRGELLQPGDASYDEARTIWNATIDRRPAVIVRCQDASDAAWMVDFARELGLLLAVRGGGHNIAGNAVCDDGVVIDLSQMKAVSVDAAARRATVEEGRRSATSMLPRRRMVSPCRSGSTPRLAWPGSPSAVASAG